MIDQEIISEMVRGLAMTEEESFRYCDLTKKFDITMNFIDQGANLLPHLHDQTVINLVLEGELSLTQGNQTTVFTKGQWLRILKGSEHSVSALTPVVLLELWEK